MSNEIMQVNITINDQPLTVPEGTTILEAAKNIGIDHPHPLPSRPKGI